MQRLCMVTKLHDAFLDRIASGYSANCVNRNSVHHVRDIVFSVVSRIATRSYVKKGHNKKIEKSMLLSEVSMSAIFCQPMSDVVNRLILRYRNKARVSTWTIHVIEVFSFTAILISA